MLVAPAKGRLPESSSYRTTPNEKMSLRASAGFPDACSGDMYGMVPISTPGCVRPPVMVRVASESAGSCSFARPKSASFA